MKNEIIIALHKNFEEYAHQVDGEEYWFARELQGLLGYTQWRNFEQVIDKAKIACQTAGHLVNDHFADVSKIVDIGSGAERKIEDIMLTRYACYLIAQNGDPRKVLTDRGIKPEELPPAEDIKKLERRVKSEEKKLPKQSGRISAKGNKGNRP